MHVNNAIIIVCFEMEFEMEFYSAIWPGLKLLAVLPFQPIKQWDFRCVPQARLISAKSIII